MTLPLTEKQERLWRYIKSCERSPTYAEMARDLGHKVKGAAIHRTVEALEAKGYVCRTRGRARSVIAIDPPANAPVITTAALMAELDRRGLGVVLLPLHGCIS